MILINLIDYLHIQTKEKSPEKVILSMKIEEYHKQPYGIMHGGMNGILIETACSLGANEHLSPKEAYSVGVDLQVNHLKSVSSGELIVIATPDHVGRSIQVWKADIYDEKNHLISVGRCTLMNQLITKTNQTD